LPNTPAQFPNIDLPGAEYLSLAPSATVAIQGRRRFASMSNVVGGMTGFPIVGTVEIKQPLETNFTDSAGIYVHHFQLILGGGPGDTTFSGANAGLTRQNTAAPFNANMVADYQLGNAIFPMVNVNNLGMLTLTTDRDKFIAAKDIMPLSNGVATQNLSLYAAASVVVPTSVAFVLLYTTIIYSRLDGITE
jgi:hypothetical protein